MKPTIHSIRYIFVQDLFEDFPDLESEVLNFMDQDGYEERDVHSIGAFFDLYNLLNRALPPEMNERRREWLTKVVDPLPSDVRFYIGLVDVDSK